MIRARLRGSRELEDRATGPGRSNRFYDPQTKQFMVKVLPGEHYVTDEPEEVIVTVLGSCVSACMRDPVKRIGGMNHFMLPGEARGTWGGASNSMRYGQFAMEQLINDLLASGARRERLEIKLFGGANVMRSSLRVGDNNALFARSYLAAEDLAIAAEDLGGSHARRIHYYPLTGKVMRRELRQEPEGEVFETEMSYRSTLGRENVEGSVELFG